ncbi:MAG: hypothetical protein ACLGG7_04340 [Bacteriovoracia bacterium]
MDDMSFLVEETFRLSDRRLMGELEDGEETWEPQAEDLDEVVVPSAPGLVFHLEQSRGTFVVRTLPTENMQLAVAAIKESPEDYPSLRFVTDVGGNFSKLRWFEFATLGEAEVVHQRVGQRRFPQREEDVCNLSDPGFSWWLEPTHDGFVIHSKMGLLKEGLTRLEPLADAQLAPYRWNVLAQILGQLPIDVEIRQENNRLVMSAQNDQWLLQEFLSIFKRGEVTQELQDVFRLLSKRGTPPALLETCWFFLTEMAAVRRFWMAVEDQLDY